MVHEERSKVYTTFRLSLLSWLFYFFIAQLVEHMLFVCFAFEKFKILV